MNLLLATQLLGWLLALLGGLQLILVAAAYVFDEPASPYWIGALTNSSLGVALALGIPPQSQGVRPRDGLLIVSLAWLTTSLIGANP